MNRKGEETMANQPIINAVKKTKKIFLDKVENGINIEEIALEAIGIYIDEQEKLWRQYFASVFKNSNK